MENNELNRNNEMAGYGSRSSLEEIFSETANPVGASPDPSMKKNFRPQMPREKKHNWKLIVGFLCGVLLTLLGVVLYVGYFTVPIPGRGLVTVALPTYRLFHGSEEGELNTAEFERKLEEVRYYLDNEFLYDTDSTELSDAVFRGIMGSIGDDYAKYYSVEEYEEERNSWSGTYQGIGIYVISDEETGGVYVVRPVKNGPAEEAGIKAGDVIIKADGVDLRGMELETATAEHLKGEKGTFVKLTVLRDGHEIEFEVQRREIDNETVFFSVLESGGKKYGYIYVSQFLSSTGRGFLNAVDQLESEGVEGLIIDLRDNPGGDMNTCLDMADYLLEDEIGTYSQDAALPSARGKTLLLTIHQKTEGDTVYYAQDRHRTSLPAAVLVNENSASASEIFAGVMKSYGFPIVGTVTYGKGIVQTVRMLYDKSGLKYTSGEYILPDGSRIHGVGITPDSVTEASETLESEGADPENPDPQKDNQLAEAVRILSEQNN